MHPRPVISVVAALITDDAGRLLLVRKRGTDRFMQAGGKPEAGETARGALVRELGEELALTVPPEELAPLGHFETQAANEAGHLLRAEVYALRVNAPVAAPAEIAEAIWVSGAEADAMGDRLAPLARILLQQHPPAPRPHAEPSAAAGG